MIDDDDRKDDPEDGGRWVVGGFYFNRKDPRVLVPKQLGFGRTLNLARPASWLVLAVLVAIVIVLVLHHRR